MLENEQDEIITPEVVDDEEEKSEDVTPEEEVTEDQSQDEDDKDEEVTPQPESEEDQEEGPILIDGVQYTKEELDQIFFVGKRVSDYQKDHPGYDPILLHKDYTQKAQELARLKKAVPPEHVAPQKPSEPLPDLSEFRKEDVEAFNKLASALGYAKAEDIEKQKIQLRQQDYETKKQQQINQFLEKHPEYKKENDPQDIKWGAILSEFSLYKMPENPADIGKLLERADKEIKGISKTFDSKKVAEILTKKKAAKAAQTSSGGGTGTDNKPVRSSSKKSQRLVEMAKSGALKGYSKQELEDMFG